MYGVAATEHPAGLIMLGPLLIDVPERARHDVDGQLRVADKGTDLFEHNVIGYVGFALGHVEAPSGDPLAPRSDRPQQTHADLTETGLGVEDPMQNAWPVSDVLAQIRVEQDVGGAGTGELAFEGQSDLFGDLRAGTVEAEQEARSLGELGARAHIPESHRDTVLVLAVIEVFGVETDQRTAFGRVLDQYRFHQG